MTAFTTGRAYLVPAAFALILTAHVTAEEQEPPPLAVAPFNAEEAKAYQEAWAEHLGQPVEVTNSIGMKLRLIPPGEFMIGAPRSEEGRRNVEGPQHIVRITSPFYLGSCEVTQEEYGRVVGTNPSAFSPRGRHSDRVSGLDTSRFPVEQVGWDDAMVFCRKLSALHVERSAGREYRLPTEAEWEYACRAGTMTPFHFGSALDSGNANCVDSVPLDTSQGRSHLHRTTTAGSYSPNGFGLYDMHGNVGEWCADWFDRYGANSLVNDPQGPRSGLYRVIRGGGWCNVAVQCRSAFRGATLPVTRRNFLGFRVVMVPAE